MNKALKYKIVVFVVAFFLAVLIPSGINASSQIQNTSIATAIGIDKSEKGIEVSVQVVVPQPSTNYSPKYVIASAEGKNLPEAIENIELKLGQELGLAHCFVIVLGDEVCNLDLADVLDFLMRSNIMGNNSALLHTEKTAKELLKQSSKLSESDINNLQHIAKYNQEHYSSSNTDLVSFFNTYFSKCPFSVIGSLKVDDDKQSSQSGQSGENQQSGQNGGQQSGGSNGSDEAKVLKNEGNAIVLKKGKKIATLEKDDLIKFGWLDSKAQKGFLVLEHVKNNIFEDATIVLHIKNKSVSFETKLENNQPILKTNIFFEAYVESVEDKNQNLVGMHQNLCSEDFQKQIETTIKSQIADALNLSKEHGFDIFGAFKIFNSQKNQQWKQYISSLENPFDYIQNLEITTNISMHHKL